MRRFLVMTMLHFFLVVVPPARAALEEWRSGPLVEGGSDPTTGTNGAVSAMIEWDPDGSGPQRSRLVIGGSFTSVQGVTVSCIAERDPYTGQWQRLGGATYGGIVGPQVLALTVYQGKLIAGGDFAVIGGQSASFVAAWDGFTWQPLGPGANFRVTALTTYNGDLVAAGDFSSATGSYLAKAIARWNGSAWLAMDDGIGAAGVGTVAGLTVGQGYLFAGGRFPGDDTVARWNGSTWTLLGGPDAYCSALTFYNGDLIVSGTVNGGQAIVARWNGGTSWPQLGSGFECSTCSANPGWGVIELNVHNGALIAAGRFTTNGGQPVTGIGRWDGLAWQPLASGLDFDSARLAGVYAMTVHDGELVVGGGFATAGGQMANRIARWDGTSWNVFGGGTTDRVLALTNFGSRVIAGGSFYQPAALGGAARNVVAWDGVALSRLGLGMDNDVQALLAFKRPGVFGKSELIAGGLFTRAGGVDAAYIARWIEDPTEAFPPPAWEPMASGFTEPVTAIERFNGQTYAAGFFAASEISNLNRIARWNETTDAWESVGTGMNHTVFALKSYGGYLYAGGQFTSAGGVSTGGLARWNGTSWSQVGGHFLGVVLTLEVHDGELVIGGTYPGLSAPNIAKYNGLSYSNLGSGGMNGAVRALKSAGSGRGLYVGGDFTTAGGVAADYVAFWNAGAWSPVQGGADDMVAAIATYHDEIHVGGYFRAVQSGSLNSPAWARYLVGGTPWLAYEPSSLNRDARQDALFTTQPAAGYEPLSYRWDKNGIPLNEGATGTGSTIIGATNSKDLRILNVSIADEGEYRLVLSNSYGADTSSVATLTVNGTVDVESPGAPLQTNFTGLGPNPSRGAVQLMFTLARDAFVRLRIYDVVGRSAGVLDLGHLPEGRHQASWDGRGHSNTPVGAGLYFVELQVDGQRKGTRRVMFLR